jgi:formylmethanofuran dehydrogenase subunit C
MTSLATVKQPRTAFDSRLFRGFKTETEAPERKAIKPKNTKTIAHILELWNEIRISRYGTHDEDIYRNISKKLKSRDYGAEEVERFCIRLIELKDSYDDPNLFNRVAGLFISALVNNGRDEEYTLQLNHLDKPLDHIGHYNEKRIKIDGNAGWACGLFMKNGRIEVFGDAGGGVGGHMENGEIIIHGNVDGKEIGEVGGYMTNGRIVIDGKVNGKIGEMMKSGQITIKGKVFGKVGELMQGGTIQIGKDVIGNVGKSLNRGTITIEGNVTGGANGFGVWMYSWGIPGGRDGDISLSLISHRKGRIEVNGKIMHCLLFKPMTEGIDGTSVRPGSAEFTADIYHKGILIAAKGKTFNCLEAMPSMTDSRRRLYADWYPSL